MSLKIIFMGTPDFAVPSLQALMDHRYCIAAVFCQPDKPKGRGNVISMPPVKELALEHGIPVFQPNSLKDPDIQQQIRALAPDLIVTAAYGKILPKEVLEIPRLVCINVHGSLLPKWRGAAPIQWSILNGDQTTGVTIMYMGEGLDTGDIILQQEMQIGPDETSGELFDRMAPLGAALLLKVLPLLEAGIAPRIPQEESNATYAAIIRKEMAEVDFSKPAQEIGNLVRGMNPWPAAYSYYDGQRVIFHKVEVVRGEGAPGVVLNAKDLTVACGECAIRILQLQPQGKKAMDGAAFANGKRLLGGEKFISPSYSG